MFYIPPPKKETHSLPLPRYRKLEQNTAAIIVFLRLFARKFYK